MKVKTLKNYTKNLLNNQNYILWKAEKKKLLSKFFIEKNLKNIFNILNKFNNVIFSWKYFFLLPGIVFILSFIFLTNDALKNGFLIIIWLITSILTIWMIYFINIVWFKNNISWIKNFKDFFFKKGNNQDVEFILWWIKFILWMILFFYFVLNLSAIWILFWITELTYFVFLFLFVFCIIFMVFFLSFNLLNTIVFLLILLWYLMLVWIVSFIYTFLFKWDKWYIFIKYKPITQFLEKFKNIESKSAKNIYYEINEKQKY